MADRSIRAQTHRPFQPLLGLFAALMLCTEPAVGEPLVCGPLDPNALPSQTCVAARDVSLFVGTLTVAGVAVPSIDLVWSSDLISTGVLTRVLDDPAVDARITAAALGPYVDLGTNDVLWALGSPGNLVSALVAQAALLEAMYGPGTLQIGAGTLLSGPTSYIVAQFGTSFEDPACPLLGGVGPERVCEGVNTYLARVGVFELNATWTLNAVPEPGTLALLGFALAGMAASRRRRR